VLSITAVGLPNGIQAVAELFQNICKVYCSLGTVASQFIVSSGHKVQLAKVRIDVISITPY
jgi:hypothetical protein